MAHNRIALKFRLSEAKKASAMIAAGSEHSQFRGLPAVLSNSRLLISVRFSDGRSLPKISNQLKSYYAQQSLPVWIPA
jgi:hypothetical protein